jgi:hypothetical protein
MSSLSILAIIFAFIALAFYLLNQKTKSQISKPQFMDPSQIMFNMATLEANFPEFSNEQVEPAFIMHEDDWRQIEFISRDNYEKINLELSKIKDIYNNFTHDGGTYKSYKKMAMRDSITNPVNINFDQLLNKFSVKKTDLKNFAILDGGLVEGGFTFEAYGCSFYGVQVKGTVNIFGAYELSKNIPDVIIDFLSSNNLYFVDWNNMSKI